MTAEEIVHQLNDDGIMTENKAVGLIESYANQKALTIIEQAVNDLIEVYGDDNERYDAMYHGGWILETVRRKLKEAT